MNEGKDFLSECGLGLFVVCVHTFRCSMRQLMEESK